MCDVKQNDVVLTNRSDVAASLQFLFSWNTFSHRLASHLLQQVSFFVWLSGTPSGRLGESKRKLLGTDWCDSRSSDQSADRQPRVSLTNSTKMEFSLLKLELIFG